MLQMDQQNALNMLSLLPLNYATAALLTLKNQKPKHFLYLLLPCLVFFFLLTNKVW